jgi:4-diphosphocytidyl-2-C-methyl-D-erythritol kinase
MQKIEMESFGKINLALDVLYKRQDNYHEINTIMQQISLRDRLTFIDEEEEFIIESDNKEMPLNSTNLVYQAWETMKSISGINRGLRVIIEKNIPIAAGLAGGSSNCAATLQAINQLWNLKLSQEELMTIGKSLGADIPFCILGGTAQAKGIGEKLKPLKPFKDKLILLANPGFGISTEYAYSKLNLNGNPYDIDSIIRAIEEDDIYQLVAKLKNRLEEEIIKEYPIIDEIKNTMIQHGALGSLMSGSGPTVFGIFDDQEKLQTAKAILSEKVEKVYACTTV